jgi:hypothetical protein
MDLKAACLIAALVACGGRGAARPRPTDDCRAMAIHGRKLIEREPAAERAAAIRLVASLVDLCQTPGLAASTRACVVAAPSIAGVRGCPALTEVVGDATIEGGGPSCRDAVDHAMKLLETSSSRPRSRDGVIEARSAYLDGCAELTSAGRACIVDADTIAAVDDCFADPALSLPADT